jgi:large subunit ribosomal protein L9
MKIILKETMENLGTVGDVVSVKDGYARNYLIPRGFATLADSRNVKAVEHQKKALEKKRLREISKAQELAAAVEGTRLVFQRKTSDQGQLFGSVTHLDIGDAIAQKGFPISRKQVALDQPIKSLGEFAVTIRLQGQVKAKVNVVVEREGEA